MMQELAQQTDADLFVVLSMLLFMGVFAIATYRTLRTSRAVSQAHARIPLEDAPPGTTPADREVRDA